MKHGRIVSLVATIAALTLMSVGLPTFAAVKNTAASAPSKSGKVQVQETILPNGLKVLTKEVHSAPVVSFMVWYKVGSRNEEIGGTGLSHLLEHMQFKGTETLKKGEIDKLIRSNGGMSNAGTSKDFTFYWETLSSDKLELAMRIESDRMVNSLLDPKEFKSEMTVVRSELEGDENDPDRLDYYELYAAAFKDHPYMWPTIGWRHDVEHISRDQLYKYYKAHYMPNNATVVIVGDFDTPQALKMAKKYFGPIEKGIAPPKVTAVEPEQIGERRAEVRKSGSSYRVMIGFHSPALGNRDMYALDVLQFVLSTGTTSRLYKALVDKQLATSVEVESIDSKDPSLFIVSATVRDGVEAKDVEAAILAEIERIKTDPITDDELRKALNQSEAQFIYENDSVTSQAQILGEYETMLSWKYRDTYLANVKKVSKIFVQRVAQRYLTEKNRTVVTFVPEKPKPGEKLSTTHSGGNIVVHYRPTDAPYASDQTQKTTVKKKTKLTARTETIRPVSVTLSNGMVVVVQENRSNPTVVINGSLKAGSMFDPASKYGLAEITDSLLMKGTTKRTADDIGAAKDFAGMGLQMSAEPEKATFAGNSLTKDFDLMLDLLSDTLRNPVFPDKELEKLRQRRLSGIKELEENPSEMAAIAFYGSIFPKGHPYYKASVDELLTATSAITRDDVENFYKSHYGPQSIILVVVGDVDANEAILKIKKYFEDWQPTGPIVKVDIPDVPLQTSIVKRVVEMPDKSEVDAYLGFPGLKRTDSDFYAAYVMNFILGGDPLGSRLGISIRDNMGLTYNVYSMFDVFDAGLGAGPWFAWMGTNPANMDKATKALVDQIKLMHDKGATKQELKEAVDFLTGYFPVRLETNAAMAHYLHYAMFNNLGLDYIRNYQKIYRAVTLAQVNAAAKKYLHPDKYTLAIAGTYGGK